MKDYLKSSGLNVAIIGDKFSKYTSSGAIIQRKLLEKGAHVLVFGQDEDFTLARLRQVQDIGNFELKDYKKPVRDMDRGMMPPKVARMLVNVARGQFKQNYSSQETLIWDPFCGLGSTGLECVDLGLYFEGSDLSSQAINGSKQNLNWYAGMLQIKHDINLFVHDATKPIDRSQFKKLPNIICAEGYLGKIVAERSINESFIQAESQKLAGLYEEFFKQVANMPEIKIVCMALPFWIYKGRNYFLPDSIFKHLTDKFQSLSQKPFTYKRQDSVVGREIILWKRKS